MRAPPLCGRLQTRAIVSVLILLTLYCAVLINTIITIFITIIIIILILIIIIITIIITIIIVAASSSSSMYLIVGATGARTARTV